MTGKAAAFQKGRFPDGAFCRPEAQKAWMPDGLGRENVVTDGFFTEF